MAELTVMGHVLKGLAKGIGRVILAFFIAGIIVAALTEVLHLVLVGHNGTFTHVGAAALGVGWGLAVAFFVLVFEVARVAIEAARDASAEVKKGVGEVGGLVGGAIQSVEGKLEHK